ncbi:MAG TPA: hypothetical protein ENK40_00930 [Gammaproteobacteria bacterium]|nr:hypothetical protein [Gammaproteobacteria bacterium]
MKKHLPRYSIFPLLDPGEPLRKRVPVTDEQGRGLHDFMVLVPGLRDKPQALIQEKMTEIYAALSLFGDSVVFAELNLKLNLLWVSVKPRLHIAAEIAGAVQEILPNARLVTHV